jgi:diguanylate cyclase (GGDEF)-like protein
MERTMRRQTAMGALVEQWRGRILEDINKSRPLADILEQITEMASFKLNGAPCWCEVSDGALLGTCPIEFANLRILEQEIPSRSGPPLGALFAAFDAATIPHDNELKALGIAAKLATLAIETSQAYNDLRRRSEFDLLTDIHNRFSFDTYLESRMEEARLRAANLALIYIDLDGFKRINDSYGHQVGDTYLREAALRMKSQLRPGDMLARLGGDEFVALVPVVRGHGDIEEILNRLERCFDEPFIVSGHILYGSASLGMALYPQDGSTKDKLLAAADAAMYVGKQSKAAYR